MFITKEDRARRKMEEDFKSVTIDPLDFGGLTTLDQIDNAFNEMCLSERKRLQFSNADPSHRENSKFIRGRANSRREIDRIGKTVLIQGSPLQNTKTSLSPGNRIGVGLPRVLSDIIAAGSDVLEMFGINLQVFCSLKSTEEKTMYILGSMKAKIESDLEQFNESREKKEEEHFIREEQYKVLKKKNESKNSKKDIFEWMKVPTSFNLLKKKLRQKIVETIGDGENYHRLQDELNGQEMTRTQMATQTEDSSSSQAKFLNLSNTHDALMQLGNIHLKGKRAQTSESTAVIGRVETQRSEYNLMEDKRKFQLSNLKFDNSSILEETNKFITSSKVRKQLQKSQRQITQEGDERNEEDWDKKHLEELKIKARDIDAVVNQVRGLPEKFDWVEEKEALFDEKRRQARYKLVYLCNSSSWNEVGFSKFINEIRFNDQNKNIRDNLISRYMSGEWLTEAEIRYIAVTSEGLNRFLDRDYFNNAIKVLDEEAIDEMEMKIAENIISQYREIRKLVYDSRDQFLKEHSAKVREEINKEGRKTVIQIREEKQRMDRNRVILKRNVEKMKQRLENLELKKMQRRLMSSVSRVKDVLMMKKKERDLLQIKKSLLGNKDMDRKMRWKEFLERNFKERIQSTLYGDIGFKEYKHKSHPSSKLIVGLNHGQTTQDNSFVNQEDPWRKKIYTKENLEEMKFFKLASNEKDSLKDRKRFLGFYSQGPKNIGNNGKKEKMASIKMREKAATCIQAGWRHHKAIMEVKKLRMKQEEKRIGEVLKRKEEKARMEQEGALVVRRKIDLGQSMRVYALRSFLDKKKSENNTQKAQMNISSLQSIETRELSGHRSQGKETFMDYIKEKEVEESKAKECDEEERKKKEEEQEIRKKNSRVFTNLGNKRSDNTAKPEKLLKNRQLLVHSKQGNMDKLKTLGFHYTPTDVNVRDKFGNTPLYYSAKIGNVEICNWLMERGADPNAQGLKKNTPVHMAFLSQNPYVVMALCKKGGSLDMRNEDFFTPLGFGNPSLLAFLNLDKAATKDESKNPPKNDIVFKTRYVEKIPHSEPAILRKFSRKILDSYEEETQVPSEKNLLGAYIIKKA